MSKLPKQEVLGSSIPVVHGERNSLNIGIAYAVLWAFSSNKSTTIVMMLAKQTVSL